MNEAQHKTANMRFYVAFIRFVHVCHICVGALGGEKKIYESRELELQADRITGSCKPPDFVARNSPLEEIFKPLSHLSSPLPLVSANML